MILMENLKEIVNLMLEFIDGPTAYLIGLGNKRHQIIATIN